MGGPTTATPEPSCVRHGAQLAQSAQSKGITPPTVANVYPAHAGATVTKVHCGASITPNQNTRSVQLRTSKPKMVTN